MTCACCGAELTVVGEQVYPPKYNLKNKVLVECQNPACAMNKRTATTESHAKMCEDAKQEKSAWINTS